MGWGLASFLFVFRIPGLHPFLVRVNGSRAFVHWGLFTPSDPATRPGTYVLEYRDRGQDGQTGTWQTGASGHFWAWHAFLWLPERAIALAVQNMGRDIKSCLYQKPPIMKPAVKTARILEAYVARKHPSAPGAVRELRIVRRFVGDSTSDECIMVFSASNHAVVD